MCICVLECFFRVISLKENVPCIVEERESQAAFSNE